MENKNSHSFVIHCKNEVNSNCKINDLYFSSGKLNIADQYVRSITFGKLLSESNNLESPETLRKSLKKKEKSGVT